MPTHMLAQVSIATDDVLPRNRMVITPCFRHSTEFGLLSGPDFTGLATDLANGVDLWSQSKGELTVKIYNLEGAPPHDPLASVTLRTGTAAAINVPRELAICLSFNGGPNRPKNRGRLYVPAGLTGTGTAGMGPRPNGAARQKVADLVPIFAGLGGANVDWIVWSRANAAATRVERWFVDDEWDIQRRRGSRPTTRLAGTTSG